MEYPAPRDISFSVCVTYSISTIEEAALSLRLTMEALAPVAYLCTSIFLSAVANRSSPKNSLGLIGLSVSLALLAFRRMTDITSWAELSSLLCFFVLLWISHIVKLLALDATIPPSEWRMIYKRLFDFRGINSSQKQDRGRPHDTSNMNMTFSSEETESRRITGSSKVPEHRVFLLKRLASAATILLLNQAYTIAYSVLLQLSNADFHPSKQSYVHRIHTVTVRETTIRSWMVFNFVWSSWAMFTAIHDILAFVHVAIGIDEPKDWPRLYGSIFEAYSIRRFWGKFWHHLIQRSYGAYGTLLSQKILRLPPGSFADRTCVNFSVFLISGIVHGCITLQLGFKCGYWEDLAFFVMCYAALLVEKVVQRAASWAFGGAWPKRWICRILGYFWVFGFLFWVLPKHQYPKVLCAPA